MAAVSVPRHIALAFKKEVVGRITLHFLPPQGLRVCTCTLLISCASSSAGDQEPPSSPSCNMSPPHSSCRYGLAPYHATQTSAVASSLVFGSGSTDQFGFSQPQVIWALPASIYRVQIPLKGGGSWSHVGPIHQIRSSFLSPCQPFRGHPQGTLVDGDLSLTCHFLGATVSTMALTPACVPLLFHAR